MKIGLVPHICPVLADVGLAQNGRPGSDFRDSEVEGAAPLPAAKILSSRASANGREQRERASERESRDPVFACTTRDPHGQLFENADGGSVRAAILPKRDHLKAT